MTSSIVKFLNEHYTDSVFYSHVSLIPRTGKYQFNRDSIEEFWKIYCTTVLENDDVENPQLFGIAEKPEHYLPVLVDFDIKILKCIYYMLELTEIQVDLIKSFAIFYLLLVTIVLKYKHSILKLIMIKKNLGQTLLIIMILIILLHS
jgi:hypothetical protein